MKIDTSKSEAMVLSQKKVECLLGTSWNPPGRAGWSGWGEGSLGSGCCPPDNHRRMDGWSAVHWPADIWLLQVQPWQLPLLQTGGAVRDLHPEHLQLCARPLSGWVFQPGNYSNKWLSIYKMPGHLLPRLGGCWRNSFHAISTSIYNAWCRWFCHFCKTNWRAVSFFNSGLFSSHRCLSRWVWWTICESASAGVPLQRGRAQASPSFQTIDPFHETWLWVCRGLKACRVRHTLLLPLAKCISEKNVLHIHLLSTNTA